MLTFACFYLEKTRMQIKIINKSAHALPSYETAHAAGMDLRANLDQPVSLKDFQQRQVDPADPSKSFVLFITECVYSERTLKDD